MEFKTDTSIGFTVYRTALKLQLEMARRTKPFGLSPQQWSVLNRLGELDGIPQKELAERTFKDPPTIARILDRLAERGLIGRRENPDDRRAFLVDLTDAGRELRALLLPVAAKMNEDAASGLSEDESRLLLSLLNRVQRNFQEN